VNENIRYPFEALCPLVATKKMYGKKKTKRTTESSNSVTHYLGKQGTQLVPAN